MTDEKGRYTFIAREIMGQSPLIAAVGGPESFRYNSPKVEWVEDEGVEFGYNYSQVFVVGWHPRAQPVQEAICEFTDLIEQALVAGRRAAADGVTTPGQAGGLLYFLTAERGCHVVHGNGARLTTYNVEGALAELPPDPEPILLCGTQARDYLCGDEVGGCPHCILSSPYLPESDVLILREGSIKIGHYTNWGRPHILEAPGLVPPILYADLSFLVHGVHKMGRLTGFKVELPAKEGEEGGERPL